MKKVITILAILVVLTSAVFAAETHKIKVTASVAEALPIFQLKYGTDIVTNTTAEFDAEKTGENELKYPADDDIEKGDISTTAIAETVVASIADKVKLTTSTTYHLTFKANPLVGKSTSHAVNPTATGSEIKKATGIDSHITMDAASTNLAVNESGVLTGSIDAGMSVDNIAACDLATFKFNYAADPTAPADEYEAYIELEITVG